MLHMPELHTNAFGSLHLSESTAEHAPCVWLRASAATTLDTPLTQRQEVVLHLTLDDLESLIDQAQFLIDHHRKTVWRGVDTG